jgi:hypothetical protein
MVKLLSLFMDVYYCGTGIVFKSFVFCS